MTFGTSCLRAVRGSCLTTGGVRRRKAQVAAIAAVGYPLINALGRTLRWRVEGCEHFDAIVAAGRQPIMAFWHGRILPATFYFRRRGIVVITSENFDGEWIARIIERFGYGTARGSTSRGGARALLQLVRDMERAGRRGSRSTARGAGAGGAARRRLAGAGDRATRSCRFTSKRRVTGRCEAGTARRSRSRSAPCAGRRRAAAGRIRLVG